MPREVGREPIRRWDEDGEDVRRLQVKHGFPMLRGNLVELKRVDSQFGEGFLLVIDHEPSGQRMHGSERQLWGCPKYLETRLSMLRPGTLLEIYYLGRTFESASGRGYNFRIFEIENVADVVTEAMLATPEPSA